MPFQSEKQRRWMWANDPEMARRWTDKYGSKPVGKLKAKKKRKRKRAKLKSKK
jgi:hypothetical protein